MRERSQYYKKNDIQVSIGKLSKIIYGSKNSNLYVKTYVAHFRNHYQKSNFKYSSSYLSVFSGFRFKAQNSKCFSCLYVSCQDFEADSVMSNKSEP